MDKIAWWDVKTSAGYNGFGEIDPYIDWAFSSEDTLKHFVDPQDYFPLLLLLQDGLSPKQFAAGEFIPKHCRPKKWSDVVKVAPVYLRSGEGFAGCRYFVALVTPEFFGYFKPTHSAREVVEAMRGAISRMAISASLRAKSFATRPGSENPSAEADGGSKPTGKPEDGTVVVGIIDDGIGFANARFRTADGCSRVEHIWLQDGDCNDAAAAYGYGRSLAKHGSDGIDQMLQDATHSGLVDEDAVYARAGALRFEAQEDGAIGSTALRSSHGTHVMDIACGYEPGTAPRREGTRGPDNRPIVCVQLPSATSMDTSGASLDTFVIDGIRYILDKADKIAGERQCGRLPVVINFSYGTIAGRHDGTSDIERAIEELIATRQDTQAPLQVVIPAGNSRLKKCRAVLKFERKARLWRRGTKKSLHWRVLPDDRTTSHLEIWLPHTPAGAKSRIKLIVKPPFGEPSPPLEEQVRPFRVWGTPEQSDLGLCYVRYSRVPEPTSRGMFLVTLKPTVPVELPRTGTLDVMAPAGIWTITLENISLEPDDVVDVWIQRDDTRYGHLPSGRQSHFEDSNYVEVGEDGKVPKCDEPASMVKRAGTLNAIATQPSTIVIGGFRRTDFTAADYSGEGPALLRIGPDALAASDDAIVHSGVLAAGTRSGSSAAFSGTSVAAPQITRLVACLMAAGEQADPGAIERLAAREDEVAGTSRPHCPKTRGAGRVRRPLIVQVERTY